MIGLRLVASATLLALALPAFSASPVSQKISAAELKKGGYIVYFRHFETGKDTPDQVKADVAKCATQRNLNAKGLMDAQKVGLFFEQNAIPVGKVFSSPFCRAWQSAAVAFRNYEVVDGLKLPPSKDYSDAQKADMAKALKPLLAAAPAPGTNTVIMAHDDNMPAVGGPELKAQGDAVIVKPDGKGGFEVVAEVKIGKWQTFLAGK
ncbi:MAG: histidine phosphatase family protein [Proteobacteria bacterium]|nr:histidine phosphatase family protein [Pseudomonadota bacterium]